MIENAHLSYGKKDMSLSGAFWIWFGQWLLTSTTSTTRMTTKNVFQLFTLLPTGKFGLLGCRP